jgi:hypothetical protein
MKALLAGDIAAVLPQASREWAALPQGPREKPAEPDKGRYDGQTAKSYQWTSDTFERNRLREAAK